MQSYPTIFVDFGNAYTLTRFKNLGKAKAVVLSYEVKAMKPARSIYDFATQQAGVPAERIFFTDDRLDNIAGAKEALWQVSQFTDAASLLRVVQSWG